MRRYFRTVEFSGRRLPKHRGEYLVICSNIRCRVIIVRRFGDSTECGFPFQKPPFLEPDVVPSCRVGVVSVLRSRPGKWGLMRCNRELPSPYHIQKTKTFVLQFQFNVVNYVSYGRLDAAWHRAMNREEFRYNKGPKVWSACLLLAI